MKDLTPNSIRKMVREHYGKVASGQGCGCVPSGGAGDGCCSMEQLSSENYSTTLGYTATDLEGVVDGANMNLGCGNPVAISGLKQGEKVLDLGCGGGFDSFLASKAVGAKGQVIGVDMTPEMIEKARKNQKKMVAGNVSFRLGEIEHLPVADAGIDVILSNCVINLSPDKPQVWREAYRVLRPGGRISISDVVAIAPLPENLHEKISMLTGCIAGAENVDTLREQLEAQGFENIRINIQSKSRDLLRQWFPEIGIEQYVASADIKAYKPRSNGLALPEGTSWIQEVKSKAEDNMCSYGNCTQSIVSAFLDVLNVNAPLVQKTSSGFLGGMTHSLTCGVHTAGVLTLGLIMGRERLEKGMDGLYPLISATRELIQRLNGGLGSHSCKELTGVDFTDIRQAAVFNKSEEAQLCIGRVGTGTEIIAGLINEMQERGELLQSTASQHHGQRIEPQSPIQKHTDYKNDAR